MRRVVGSRVLGELTLYLLYRLAGMRIYNVEEEKLVKLLFLALYAEPRGERLKLRRDPPLLDAEAEDRRGRRVRLEFRIYRRGPFIPLGALKRLVDEVASRLVGYRVEALRVQRLPSGRVLVGLTDEMTRRRDTLEPVLRDLLAKALGGDMLRDVDAIVVRVARLPAENVTKLALDVLDLDEELKAMAFNMPVDRFIEVRRRAARIGEELLEHGDQFTLDEEWVGEQESG